MDFAARIARARDASMAAGVEVLLLSVGPDLPYFTGYRAPQLERLTMAVLPADGDATLVVPQLEAMKVADTGAFSVRPWVETEDPVSIVAALVGGRVELAIGDHTWARFLIQLQMALPGARFRRASTITSAMRALKDPAEVEELAAAAAAADRVATALSERRFSGTTERVIAAAVRDLCLLEGHDEAWDPIVASGPNAASPHHEPTDRVIEDGDLVVVDFGGTVAGYHSDTSRTFCVGGASEDVAAAYGVLRHAQQAAVDAVAPGVPAQDIDRAARRVIDAAGFGALFIHRTGHGIGLDIHEDPYLVEGNEQPLGEGMAFSVEPGLYERGRWGMRIEDIVVVTAEGCRRLNQSSRDLVVVA